MIIIKGYALGIMLALLGIILYMRYKEDESINLKGLLVIIFAALLWPLAIFTGIIAVLTDPNMDTPVIIKSKTALLKAREEKIRKRKEKEGYDR